MENESTDLLPPTPAEVEQAAKISGVERIVAKWILPIRGKVEEFLVQEAKRKSMKQKGGREAFIAEIMELGIAVDKQGNPLKYEAIDTQISNIGHFMRVAKDKEAADAAAAEEQRQDDERKREAAERRKSLREKFGLPPE